MSENSTAVVSSKASGAGDGREETTTTPVTITKATYLFVMCASLNSCNLGFDIGVSTEAGRLIQNDMGLSQLQRELFIGSLNFWACFGALLAQSISDRFGRRMTFVIAAVGFNLGILIMILSHSLEALMVGRTFIGWGIGVGLAIDPLFIAEITPPQHRGMLVTWSEIAINIGVVFGFATSLFLSGLEDGLEWRVMFLLGAILPTLMIIVVFTIMPESPRWLVQKGRHAEALAILEQVYPEGFDVEPVLESIKEAIKVDSATNMAMGWSFLWNPSPAVFRMLLVGVGAPLAQQAVGIDAIQYYLADVIARSGIESKEAQSLVLILMGMIKLLFVFVGGKTFDGAGRRVGLTISLGGMGISLLVVSIAYFIMDEDVQEDLPSTKATIGVLVGICFYLSFFSIGMGPGAWLIPSEVFSNVIRAKAMSLAAFASRVYATIMASTFLSVANAIGYSGFFLVLSITCFFVLAFFWMYLPETKGRSLEDMTHYFAEVTGDHSLLVKEQELSQLPKETGKMERGITTTTDCPISSDQQSNETLPPVV
eukprot:scaffold6438_cov181-Amphora_coffeaeformis.AAC.6